MLFVESNLQWRPIPTWVRFLIQFGYVWPAHVSEPRRIALISMPCDSAAAGLVTFGALIRDLGNPDANDIDGHFDALLRYARQYLNYCQDCSSRCHPERIGCGFASEATGWVRHQGRRRYKISEQTDLRQRHLVYSNQGGTWWQDPRHSIDWQIDGEPPIQLSNDQGVLPEDAYSQIIEMAKINPDNLRRSFSGLCLSGRATGENATREVCTSIRFRSTLGEHNLASLLTIHGWSKSSLASRITFFNARTEQVDRGASAPALVVADGNASFLKVIGDSKFQRSDIVGVFHRTIERNDLEALGNKIAGLRQWYIEDREMFARLPALPYSVKVLILKRRTG